MSTRVYVHIGLPKTGTTFLQSAMWDGRDALAKAGCLVPGERKPSAWWAASDLLGRRPRGSQGRRIPGAWDALSAQIRDWKGDRAVFSEELLSIANRRQIRKLVEDLGDAEVHVVVTVRDLARVLPSLWQQEIRKGRTWTWPEFLSSVRDPQSGSVTAAAAFWMRFDLEKILGAWAAEVAPERIHVVVLPAHGAPSSTLLDRFAGAIGVDRSLLESAAPTGRSNPALGADEVEVLRRLNERLDGRLNERQYVRVVGNGVIPALEARTGSTRGADPAGAPRLARRDVGHTRGQSPLRHVRRDRRPRRPAAEGFRSGCRRRGAGGPARSRRLRAGGADARRAVGGVCGVRRSLVAPPGPREGRPGHLRRWCGQPSARSDVPGEDARPRRRRAQPGAAVADRPIPRRRHRR